MHKDEPDKRNNREDGLRRAQEILDMVKAHKTEHQRLSDGTHIYIRANNIDEYPAFPGKRFISVAVWDNAKRLKELNKGAKQLNAPDGMVVQIASPLGSVRGAYFGSNI